MDSLNNLNYMNLVGYIVNALVTFFGAPVFGFPDNAELSGLYQTLVTPSGGTFAIWGLIFISQAVFTVVQMLSGYRSNKLVQDGVSYSYFVACIFQSAWIFAFGYEIIWLSVLMMFGILVSLLKIVYRQSAIKSSPEDRIKDFWLYKFPFSLHCGWIFAAFAVNVNVWVVAENISAEYQEKWAYFTLGYAVVVAGLTFFYLSPPDFTIPSVLIWAVIGIANELTDPNDSITKNFDEDIIKRVRYNVIGVCLVLTVGTIAYGAQRVMKAKKVDSTSNTSNYNEMEP